MVLDPSDGRGNKSLFDCWYWTPELVAICNLVHGGAADLLHSRLDYFDEKRRSSRWAEARRIQQSEVGPRMSNAIRLLIDGYNLMFQSVVSKQSLQGTDALRSARQQMLEQLSQIIEPEDLRHTLIVFDAKDAPKGLPERANYLGITIVFARDWESADEWMQQEIRRHPTPKKLTVVSSDHSIHQKAKARKARIVDSEPWFEMQLEAFRLRTTASPASDILDPNPAALRREHTQVASPDEQDLWLREFGFID